METDASLLKGLSLKCLDGCAYCCLCMPEIMAKEEEFFTKTHPKALFGEYVPHSGRRSQNVILQGEAGACYFLKNRKCTIYAQRPQMCRQYPISIYLSRRIQPTPILSCRGLSSGAAGTDLETLFAGILKSYDPKYLEGELRKCECNFNVFKKRAEKAGAFISQEDAAALLAPILPNFADHGFLSRAIAFANSEEFPADPNALLNEILVAPPEDANEYIREIESDTFEQEDPANLPVFIDRNLTWRIFSKEDGTLVEYELSENGNMAPKARINFDSITLLPLDAAAGAELTSYLQLNLRRDFFYDVAALAANSSAAFGSAESSAVDTQAGKASLVSSAVEKQRKERQHKEDEDFARHLAAVYLELLAQTALSVWWRASLIGKLRGIKELNKDDLRDGIIFYDADFLDSDSIGEFS